MHVAKQCLTAPLAVQFLRLPLQHFVRQLGELQFTTSELEEAEGKLEAVQQRTSSRASGGAE